MTMLEEQSPPAVTAQRPRLTRRTAWLLAGVLAVLHFALTASAMRRTSTTFDEIVLMAGGARGIATGSFDLAPDHPPLMQYLYGLPVHLLGPKLPDETGIPAAVQQAASYRYEYARQFFWGEGNDPERLAFAGRLVGALFGTLLVLLTFALTRSRWGEGAGLAAACMVAFLPDVLAHGGVAYNDVPLALLFLASVFAVDRTVREPTVLRALGAGALMGIALGIKISAAALAPIAIVLILLEAATRWRDREWLRRIALATHVVLATTYLALALVFLGEWDLATFRYGLEFRFRHMTGYVPAYFLGELRLDGWWYFYPVAFLFKTPAALHLLLLTGVAWLVRELARAPRRALTSPLRAPAVAIAVFGAALVSASLNIGFRYALPVLPLLCIIGAVGVVGMFRHSRRFVRVAPVAGFAWMAASTLSWYPWFLSYSSEYGPGKDRGHALMADSSVDWGQGLLELRDFMREEGIDRIWLSYFGSARPEGYGIDYVPLPSFGELPARPLPPGEPEPRWLAISATSLMGVYLMGDPFARFRQVEPYRVLAQSILVFLLE